MSSFGLAVTHASAVKSFCSRPDCALCQLLFFLWLSFFSEMELIAPNIAEMQLLENSSRGF